MRRWLKPIPILLLIALSGALLTACAPSPAAAIRRDPLLPAGTGKPTNLQIRQSVPWRNGAVVYYTFDQLDPSGALSECGSAACVRRGPLGWYTSSGGGGCATRSAATGPFERTGSGSGSSSDEGSWSWAYGLVTDPAAVEVRITWSDGLTDTAALVDGSYLVVRAGEVGVEQIEALDATGAVIATQTMPPPVKPPPPASPQPTPRPMDTPSPPTTPHASSPAKPLATPEPVFAGGIRLI